MKKVIIKILIFMCIAILIQGSILIYLEKYYFATSSSTSTSIANNKIKIKLSENTKEYKISYDGKYLAFMEGGSLKVVNTKVGVYNNVKFESGTSLSYYKWLPDSDKIIIAEKVTNSKGIVLKFFYYDAISKNSAEIKGQNTNSQVAIEEFNVKAEVVDIVISSSFNEGYVKILKLGQIIDIYKLYNMERVSKVIDSKYGIGNMVIANSDGKLYYEDTTTKKIKSVNGDTINIQGMSNPIILGTDANGEIFIADNNNGSIKEIYWGINQGNSNKWNVKQFSTEAKIKDVFISSEGKIFLNDNLKGVVTEINSDIKTEYEGVLQCMYDKGIASSSEGTLVMTRFK